MITHLSRFAPFFLLLLLAQTIWAQLSITVTSIPANTPDGAQIYIAGNFNGWNPSSAAHLLTPAGNGSYTIQLTGLSAGTVEFKFTRGSWATVEGNENGSFMPNRTFAYTGAPAGINLSILSWEDLGGAPAHTAAANVQILSNNFYMPQLNRNRRIWIYLPPDYETSGKNYPVLYMQDGQNLFDAYYSFAGEWQVDETLNQLFEEQNNYGLIVVGIDNGGTQRINEYSPWVNPTYGGGDGDDYANFIVNTLKPYIDTNYRTLSSREHTGIMGSSMGGLISLYTAIEYQEVFGKAGIFSPSFWFSAQCYNHVLSIGKQYDMRIYLMAGGSEGFSVIPDMLMMYNTLLNSGFSADELHYITPPDGTHSEWFWAREFEDAYLWLYNNSPATSATPMLQFSAPTVFPNPASEVIYVQLHAPVTQARVQLYSLQGQMVANRTITTADTQTIDISALPAGIYLLQVTLNQKVLYSQKLAIFE